MKSSRITAMVLTYLLGMVGACSSPEERDAEVLDEGLKPLLRPAYTPSKSELKRLDGLPLSTKDAKTVRRDCSVFLHSMTLGEHETIRAESVLGPEAKAEAVQAAAAALEASINALKSAKSSQKACLNGYARFRMKSGH